MTTKELIHQYRSLSDQGAPACALDQLQAQLDQLGQGHLTAQRGHNHPADCTCKICLPQGAGVKFQIRVSPDLAKALRRVPRERLLEELERIAEIG